MAVLYSIIGALFSRLAEMKVLLLVIYGATFLFANYGPNSTTFMLPSMTFSANVRSTLNGVSAASGKAGALLGSMLFEPASKRLGDASIMMICACISIIGFYLTFACVSVTVGQEGGSSTSSKQTAKHDPMSTPKSGHSRNKKRRKSKLKRNHFSRPSLLDFYDERT